MIEPKLLFDALKRQNITHYSGVPDSLLKSMCAYIADNTSPDQHIITANEGSAIALAAGQYLSTGKPSLVYMQNSGFGNAINPLLSLADTDVYSIPMIIMVGWRGEPGIKDEPQHVKQGAVMEPLLDACKIPYRILSSDIVDIDSMIISAVKEAILKSCPVVLLVRKNTFLPYSLQNQIPDYSDISREDAIRAVTDSALSNDVIVSTTGMASRELFEIRAAKKEVDALDFLTVGSMGHANMIALGIAQNTSRHVFCIDGDGSSLMHLGNLTTIGQSNAKNYIHVLLNNAAHDSVGGQPTCANAIDLASISKSCGYSTSKTFNNLNDVRHHINALRHKDGPHLVQINIKKGSRADLGRPTSSPIQNRKSLMLGLVG